MTFTNLRYDGNAKKRDKLIDVAADVAVSSRRGSCTLFLNHYTLDQIVCFARLPI